MNSLRPMSLRVAAASLLLLAAISGRAAEANEPTMSASELAGRLSAKQQDGTSNIRLRMEIKGGSTPGTLQLQIKSRATRAGTDLVYQVLWPKERKGEAVLLRKSGNRAPTGATFTPPNTVRSLDASQMSQPLFGSDLSYEDVIENFFAWDQQAIVGNEAVGRVNCVILESKPGKARSAYSSVRSWVDPRRLVPMRIEKLSSSGNVVRRFDTTRVVTDDAGRTIPANLTVRGPRGSVTDLDGSRIRHGVTYSDAEFTPEGLAAAAPRDAPGGGR